MKSPLYYAVVRTNFGKWRVMAVTTEKRNQVWGRWHDVGEATHARRDTVRGAWPDASGAEAVLADVAALREKYRELIQPLETQVTKLYAERDQEINALVTRGGG